MSYPKIIQQAERALKRLTLGKKGGRHNAAKDEDYVRLCLQEQGIPFEKDVIKAKQDILWNDGMIAGMYPFNIKVSDNLNTWDNVSSKGVIPYVFCNFESDDPAHIAKTIKWLNGTQRIPYLSYLREYQSMRDTGRDFYYMIYCRQNPERSFITSVRCLTNIKHNPVNMPYQVRWDLNAPNHGLSYSRSKWLIFKTVLDGYSQEKQISKESHAIMEGAWQDFQDWQNVN